MTTLDDLRQVLEEDAGLAPDGAGLVQAARTGRPRARTTHRRHRSPDTRPGMTSTRNLSQGELVVDAGSCWMLFDKSPKFTVDQLRSLATGTTFGNCDDQSTWTPPLG